MEQLEIWKDIPGYENIYQVSNLGRVKSLSRKIIRNYRKKISSSFITKELIVKPVKTSKGYLHLTLRKNGKAEQPKIHRLVIISFIGDKDLVCNHKNGIKTDNRLSNLEYCTQKENVRHAINNNLIGIQDPKNGVLNPNSKLTDNKILKIRRLLKLGIPQLKIANIYNVSQSLISIINKKKLWNHI